MKLRLAFVSSRYTFQVWRLHERLVDEPGEPAADVAL